MDSAGGTAAAAHWQGVLPEGAKAYKASTQALCLCGGGEPASLQPQATRVRVQCVDRRMQAAL